MPSFADRFRKSATVDPVWDRIREEAEAITRADTSLGGFIVHVGSQSRQLSKKPCATGLAQRLGNADIGAELIVHGFEDALEADPDIGVAARADMLGRVRSRPGTATAISNRCCTSRAFRRCRPTGWPTGCTRWAARILPTTCKVGPR